MNFFRNLRLTSRSTIDFFKAGIQVAYGAWKINQLPGPIVSIFGGTRVDQESPYLNQVHSLANILVENNISILTGGGPGIMHAANCGAFHEHECAHDIAHEKCTSCLQRPGPLRTMGIGVEGLPGKNELNPCAGKVIMVDSFYARKYLLFHFSSGFVVFPGGLGTMDELSDLINLMKVRKIVARPVILIDAEFWQGYLTWLQRSKQNGFLEAEDISIFTVTNDINQAASLLISHSKKTA